MPQAELDINTAQLDDLCAQFPYLADAITLDLANEAARAGAQVVFEEMELLAPTRETPRTEHSNALPPFAVRRDLDVRPIDNQAGWLVGPGERTAYVVRWLEFGHRLLRGKHKVVGMVEPHPFIRRSYDLSVDAAGEAAQLRLADAITRIWDRLKAKVKVA
jgi:hypothetical protein